MDSISYSMASKAKKSALKALAETGLAGTKEVDEASIADNHVLSYDGVSDKLVYVPMETGSSSNTIGTKTIDETNIADKNVLSYDQTSGNVVYRTVYEAPKIKQVTKLNITASPEVPYDVDITINYTADFTRPPVEVLKIQEAGGSSTTIVAQFNNADKTDFDADTKPGVIFDGKMKLKTLYTEALAAQTLGDGEVFTTTIDKTMFSEFKSIEVI